MKFRIHCWIWLTAYKHRKGCRGKEKYCIEDSWKAERFATQKRPANSTLFAYFTILSKQVWYRYVLYVHCTKY